MPRRKKPEPKLRRPLFHQADGPVFAADLQRRLGQYFAYRNSRDWSKLPKSAYITRRQMAALSGLSTISIERYLVSRSRPLRTDTMDSCLRALGISVLDLIYPAEMVKPEELGKDAKLQRVEKQFRIIQRELEELLSAAYRYSHNDNATRKFGASIAEIERRVFAAAKILGIKPQEL